MQAERTTDASWRVSCWGWKTWKKSRASWEEGDMQVKAQTRVNTVYWEVQDLSWRR